MEQNDDGVFNGIGQGTNGKRMKQFSVKVHDIDVVKAKLAKKPHALTSTLSPDSFVKYGSPERLRAKRMNFRYLAFQCAYIIRSEACPCNQGDTGQNSASWRAAR